MSVLRLSRKIKPEKRDNALEFISSGVSKGEYGFDGLKFGKSFAESFSSEP